MKSLFRSLAISSIAVSALVLSACSPQVKPQDDLVGSWSIKQIEGTQIVTDSAKMVFSTQGHVSGSNGCNKIMGQYNPVHDHLNLSQFALTRMACQGQKAQDAALFNAALDKVEHFLIKGDQLFLTDLQDQTVISLSR